MIYLLFFCVQSIELYDEMVKIKEPVKSQLTNDYPINLHNILYHLQLYIKAWINIIFLERNIYPSTNFTKRKIFDLEVFVGRHPALNAWVKYLIEDIFDEFERVKVITLRVYQINLKDQKERTKETYHLNLSEFLHEIHNDYSYSNLEKQVDDEDLTWNDVLNDLRSSLYSFMLKVRSLKKPDGVCKFSVSLESDSMMNSNWILDKSLSSPEKRSSTKLMNSSKHDVKSTSISVTPIDVGPMVVFPSIAVFEQDN